MQTSGNIANISKFEMFEIKRQLCYIVNGNPVAQRHTPTHLFLGISQVFFGLHQQLFYLGGLLLPLILLQLQSLCRHRHTHIHTHRQA